MVSEITSRVHEQMWTTAETMRRRIVSFGDETVKFVERVQSAGERVKDMAEPACLDLSDYVQQAYDEKEPFHTLKEDDRHTLIEMYLGTSVLLMGLSLGELTGNSDFFQGILAQVLSPFFAFLLLVLLPVRCALNFQKNAMDDTERRTSIFALSFAIGFLGSFLVGGYALLSLGPSLLFVAPTIFGLLIDNELFGLGPFNTRQTLFLVASLISQGICFVLSCWPLRTTSFGAMLFTAIHGAFLTFHAQIVVARQKDKALCTGLAQLLYVIGIFSLQALVAVTFGVSADQQEQQKTNDAR